MAPAMPPGIRPAEHKENSMRNRINHRQINLPITAIQLAALRRLLPNAISDTGSNKVAASYRQILTMADAASLFVLPPAERRKVAAVAGKPDPDGKNALRAEWAETALRAFQEETGTDDEDMLADLLCDMMHWCDREGFVFKEALRRATSHYGEETTDPEATS
jgi:hypothetical protein